MTHTASCQRVLSNFAVRLVLKHFADAFKDNPMITSLLQNSVTELKFRKLCSGTELTFVCDNSITAASLQRQAAVFLKVARDGYQEQMGIYINRVDFACPVP